MVLAVLGASGEGGTSSAEVLELSEVTPAALAERVWASSPELQLARTKVAAARAEAMRAALLPNPVVDVSVNTIPVGPVNPPDLREPLLNVPNLAVSLAVLLELGKRGPRQEATREAARASQLEALELLRQRVLAGEEVVGEVAAAEVRVATLGVLAEDAERLTRLQRARSEKGDTSPLDADRAQLDEEGIFTSLGEARDALAEALRSCTEVVGIRCAPFERLEPASAWLELPLEPGPEGPRARPDVRALEATERGAQAARLLAERRAIPDPTVRAGYVHDRFTVSGNQANSLFVGLSAPLPLFDRGHADAEAAAVAARAASRARERLLVSAGSELERVSEELGSVQARQLRLRDQSLPLAQSVVERLDAAVTRGAAPIQELLLARRTYAELLLTANDLHRTAFRLRVARLRLSGGGLSLPQELEP